MPSDNLYSLERKARCVLWYNETKSPKSVENRFITRWGRNVQVPSGKAMRRWFTKFIETGTVDRKKRENPK